MPKLQNFLSQLLSFQNEMMAIKVLQFFLTPTTADCARDQLEKPEDYIPFQNSVQSEAVLTTARVLR